jgi:hypothetical protein
VSPIKPVPVIVTDVPPPEVPELGLTDVTVGTRVVVTLASIGNRLAVDRVIVIAGS